MRAPTPALFQLLSRLPANGLESMQVSFHPNFHLGMQRHDSGFSRTEAKIKEYVAASFDAAGVKDARVDLLTHDGNTSAGANSEQCMGKNTDIV